jgi:hypothetical protein
LKVAREEAARPMKTGINLIAADTLRKFQDDPLI